jgi:predicted phosphodiesterase
MLDHIQGTLQPIPPPRGASRMALDDVVGAEGARQITQAGRIRFHAVGDTGRGQDTPQGDVASAMARDYDASHPETSPAFFFHLGDVIYGHHKDVQYRPEFYEPYAHYPGKIIAIPGNHDGEVFPGTDPETLQAFRQNFCAEEPRVPVDVAGSIYRQMVAQPGVFWWLEAPLLDLVGLYSNAAENPGFITGDAAGRVQRDWLVATLTQIAANRAGGARKALVFGTHHPPYSQSGHSGSQDMLADVWAACGEAGGITPDLFLAGHSHNYQRYTKTEPDGSEIPFIVAGTGGKNDQTVEPADPLAGGNPTYEASHRGYGYLLVDVDAGSATVRAIGVDGTAVAQFDAVTVDLGRRRIVR